MQIFVESIQEGNAMNHQVLRIPDVMNELGKSKASVYRLLRNGELQSIKVGAARCVLRADLDAYLESLRGQDYDSTVTWRPNAKVR